MNLTDLKNFLLLFLTFGCLQESVDAHSLEYHYTALTPQYTGFPEFTAVGLLDEKQFMFYSSSNKMLIPENWIKKSTSENYWKSEKQDMEGHHDDFNNIFTKIKSLFNDSRGHTLQRMYGCESDDGGITRRYDQYCFDGEDFISLDLENGTWIAVKPQALILKHDWESNKYTKFWKNFLEHDCIDLLKTFVNYGRETLKRKVRPETFLFQKESPPEVVCDATGFFPKALNISWKKDGQDVHVDVDLRETLPNQDGSFQKRSILKVSAEELQKHTYTCVIEHSSLEKDLVLPVSERRILRGGGSGGGLIGIIVGIIVALVVLVAVVAGIVVWKKKNSGFRRVPASASSDGDSCSGISVESDPAAAREGEEIELLNVPSNQNNINTSEQTALDCRKVLLHQTKDGDLKS
ncbi:patr class I histocompatibility antigen, A-5 alpha chain-like isoform X2 [Silurus meridionalis]|uniref:patr class I histocompatibility antigen, A-5 alpha chain-like isoform X2 n=1 Tax=Silurus meridionalis TaxID=175797 RepID=UPI001EEA4CBA|nr:patr class I histocompatibility antigen, A-5 alpha chain-like isoform X2 [Silurus meridionalis]